MEDIFFLNPVFTHNIWGGTRLREEFGYDVSGDDIGECWGISAHPNGEGTIKGGKFDGIRLSELWKSQSELFGNCKYDRFPLLIKIIDAKEDLSIQVHPNDDYAMEKENGSLGKTECWYVLDCPEDASLVIGHNAKTENEMKQMILNGAFNEFIREVPVKKGDFIQINPGTVHAIKGGLLILETQQNSDITYRVYDYNRLSGGKPRELHIKKSMEVIEVPAKSIESSILHAGELADDEMHLLYTCNYYSVYKCNCKNGIKYSFGKVPFLLCSVISGYGSVNGTTVKKGDHFIIKSGIETIRIEGNVEMILSHAPIEK